MTEQQNDHQVHKYDRQRGWLHGLSLETKPSTITNLETVTGKAETFIVETCRHDELGDYIFVQMVDEAGTVMRMALPPRVSNCIASQRDSLTARSRSRASKAKAQARKDRGELPGFMKRKK